MSWAETYPSFGLSCLCEKLFFRVLTSLTESPLPSFNSLSSLTEADSHAPSGCFGAPHALSHLGVDGGRVVSSTGGGSGRLGALQIGRDEEAVYAIRTMMSSMVCPPRRPTASPSRLSPPSTPRSVSKSAVALARSSRAFIPMLVLSGSQPGPHGPRSCTHFFSAAMAPFRTRFGSTGGARTPPLAYLLPASAVHSPARAGAAPSRQNQCFGRCPKLEFFVHRPNVKVGGQKGTRRGVERPTMLTFFLPCWQFEWQRQKHTAVPTATVHGTP